MNATLDPTQGRQICFNGYSCPDYLTIKTIILNFPLSHQQHAIQSLIHVFNGRDRILSRSSHFIRPPVADITTVKSIISKIANMPNKEQATRLGNLQNLINLIKRQPLGLRQQEKGPGRSEQHPARKKEPDPEAQRRKDVRQRLGDGKLHSPEGGIRPWLALLRQDLKTDRQTDKQNTHHWQSAAKVPVMFLSAPGKISAETIHGMPLSPNDQNTE